MKRQKSTEPVDGQSIFDKVAASAYQRLGDMIADVTSAVKASLADIESSSEKHADSTNQIHDFKRKAIELLRREQAYPQTAEHTPTDQDFDQAQTVLSLVGYAPQEKRLFSSLPSTQSVNLSEVALPAGVSATRIFASSPQEKVQSLGEAFAPPRALPPLQPPKQPKTSAKGNNLDFYHPELTDKSHYRSNSYFSTKLSAGHYLDYSNATPAASAKAKQHERAQSLAGKKPSSSEMELSEMESLFRGAFSSFAPCKDDSAAVVPSNVAGRMWWQRAGRANYQNMIEVEYYDDAEPDTVDQTTEIDEKAIQEAIENWDDNIVDPSLDDVMGIKRDDDEKEADEILTEVSDMIETLASFQRIRNLTLPNSQNRPTTDPVAADMLANNGPQPSEEEILMYQTLKAQLALIIKTLPPYAVARLNGDQLDDLLISTKVEISTDQYKGIMEEDDAAVQARLRAQQAASIVRPQSQQRTPSTSYANHFPPPVQQYGTPTRPNTTQQFYPQRNLQGNFQQGHFQQQAHQSQPPRPPFSQQQQRPPQPNQYSRPNGYPSQYATQLAKAQTPYGHQNMPPYATQQRPYQAGTPQRFSQPHPYQQTPQPYQPFPNGQRNMSPQVAPQTYSPTPSNIPPQRFTPTPTQNRYPQQHPSSSLGYQTVIPEAQQQRILEQAKARIAAADRARTNGNGGMPAKVTPVPVPAIPGMGTQGQRP